MRKGKTKNNKQDNKAGACLKTKGNLLIPAVKQEECKTEGSKGGVWRPQTQFTTQQSFLSN